MPAPAAAADALATDRPDFTETTEAVARGVVQAEAGFTHVSVTNGVDATGLPELLLRIGLAERVELRLGAPDAIWTRLGGTEATALGADENDTQFSRGDASVGFKVELAPVGFPIGLAAIPILGLATQDTEDKDPVPELLIAWSRDLPRGWSLGGIVGHAWAQGQRPGEDNVLFPTVALAAPLSESVGVFVEWFAEFADGAEASHSLHHGYTLGFGPDLQIDVHGGVGLSKSAPDYFVGAGVALRHGFFN